MKRFISLMSLLLLFVAGAWAALPTRNAKILVSLGDAKHSLADLPASGTQVMFYMPASDRTLFMTGPTASEGRLGFQRTASNALTAGTDVTDMLFTLESVENSGSEYYIKASNGEYLTSALTESNGTVPITTSATNKARFTVSTGSDGYLFKRSDISTDLYINVRGEALTGGWINYFSGNGGWSQWHLYVPETKDSVITVPFNLTNFSQLTDEYQKAIFTIHPKDATRGNLYADATTNKLDACGGTSSSIDHKDVAQSNTDPFQQFAFIKKNNSYYLYNVGTKKFVSYTSGASADTYFPFFRTCRNHTHAGYWRRRLCYRKDT